MFPAYNKPKDAESNEKIKKTPQLFPLAITSDENISSSSLHKNQSYSSFKIHQNDK